MPHQTSLAVPIGFADKTDILLVGPLLAGSRLLICRGVKLGLSAEIWSRSEELNLTTPYRYSVELLGEWVPDPLRRSIHDFSLKASLSFKRSAKICG